MMSLSDPGLIMWIDSANIRVFIVQKKPPGPEQAWRALTGKMLNKFIDAIHIVVAGSTNF
jgi:hypothetical protein